jgi:hypothetical protein
MRWAMFHDGASAKIAAEINVIVAKALGMAYLFPFHLKMIDAF